MQEINLGALTDSVQKNSLTQDSMENHLDMPTNDLSNESSSLSKEDDNVVEAESNEEGVIIARVLLTPENQKLLDLYRFSNPEKYLSRSQLVNAIIESFLNEHIEEITTNVKSILERRSQ